MWRIVQSWLRSFAWWRYNRLVHRTLRQEMQWAAGRRAIRPPPLPPPPALPDERNGDIAAPTLPLSRSQRVQATLDFWVPYLSESAELMEEDEGPCLWCGPPPPGHLPPELVAARSYCEALKREGSRKTCPKCGAEFA
jgi:hypothetical protein